MAKLGRPIASASAATAIAPRFNLAPAAAWPVSGRSAMISGFILAPDTDFAPALILPGLVMGEVDKYNNNNYLA